MLINMSGKYGKVCLKLIVWLQKLIRGRLVTAIAVLSEEIILILIIQMHFAEYK